jgi:hypothetical protein
MSARRPYCRLLWRDIQRNHKMYEVWSYTRGCIGGFHEVLQPDITRWLLYIGWASRRGGDCKGV